MAGARPARAEEWFDAYERGLDALKQKKAERAIEMLERAARLRPDPGTNVITYGTNRLDRYHPYLRLAEAYLMAGQPGKAQDALKRSAARGREPADERARLAAQADAALEKTRVAAAAPPTTLAAAPPVTAAAAPAAPPTTLAAAPAPPTTLAVALARGPSAAPTIAPRAAGNGTLELRSDPPGAMALLGERLLGTTPFKVELAPGDYTVTLRKEGTADSTFPVRVAPGKGTVETRTLVATAAAAPPSAPPAEAASLVVYSQPAGALVYLDDEPLGATDPRSGRLVKSGVAPGAHRVRVTRDGLADAAEEVTVPDHGPATLRIQLTPSTNFRASGFMWTAVAAAWTALLVAGAWALRRRRAGAVAEAAGSAAAVPVTPMPSATATRTPSGPRATLDGRAATAAGPATSTEYALRETSALPTPARPASDPERFGEFRLLEPLGKGGMASVFKAERRGEICALKRPLAAFLEDPEFLERFLREAEIGRTLHHPNIIRIYERGDVDGLPYFTMELVKGETLAARVRAGGALDARRATDVIAQVAEALDYAHLKGVVHRDLKPSNIMILEDGAVKVMDYGIARARRFEGLTVTGAFLGTPDYVAPETAEGKGTDARSDLYSLGIVFYEILTGKRPFVGDTPFATLRKHVSEPPTPPSVIAPGIPRELEAIILKLLAKSPDDRYPGAEELLIVLRDFLNRAA